MCVFAGAHANGGHGHGHGDGEFEFGEVMVHQVSHLTRYAL